MPREWIIEVLCDLRRYAYAERMPELAAILTSAVQVAELELANTAAGPMAPRPDAGLGE